MTDPYHRENRRDRAALLGCLTPCRPTEAEPGSAQRIEAYAARVASNETLFHADDPVMSHAPSGDASDGHRRLKAVGYLLVIKSTKTDDDCGKPTPGLTAEQREARHKASGAAADRLRRTRSERGLSTDEVERRRYQAAYGTHQ